MRSSVVKKKLAEKKPVHGVCLHLTDPSLHELVGLMGFDFIWMDMEHHAYDVQTANDNIRASRVGRVDIMTRCAKGEFMRMGRMLECGAHGIMYPRISNAAEAREVVKWAKFAPMGQRGFDGGNPDMPYCTMDMVEYLKFANDNTWIVAQIEDEGALNQVEEIAAVPGIDVVMLGQADFSVLSGIPGQFGHQKIKDALARIKKATDAAGKAWGTPAGTKDRVKELLDMGALWIPCGCDLIMVKTGLEKLQAEFAPLGFTYNNQLVKGESYMQKS
jgi:4-hydroxy-2-oxoheptanedioate aldolase